MHTHTLLLLVLPSCMLVGEHVLVLAVLAHLQRPALEVRLVQPAHSPRRALDVLELYDGAPQRPVQRERETHTERDRERDTERDTERERERQTDRQTERDRQTEKIKILE